MFDFALMISFVIGFIWGGLSFWFTLRAYRRSLGKSTDIFE
jgi:hypothetical protein